MKIDELDLEALRRIAQPLDGGAPWSVWMNTRPAVQGTRGLLDRITHQLGQISPLVPFLEQVCWHPRSTLRLEEERLLAERARRLPERAVAVLLAHPEDWAGRSLRHVHPRRILSTVAEDDWGIYENRLAVQLVHQLVRWSAGCLDGLRRTERIEQELSDFSMDTRGSHWRSKRLCELWGDLVEQGDQENRTTTLRRRLEAEHLRLRKLLDAPLCRLLGPPGHGLLTLRPTNVLSHDSNYSKVAALWRRWLATAQAVRETEQEKRQKQAQAAQDASAFATLLVLRALQALGYTPAGDPTLEATQGALTLTGEASSLKLSWDRGGIKLTRGPHTLQIDTCSEAMTAERAPSWAPACGKERLSLLLGQAELASHAAPGAARALHGWSWPCALLVSPWNLDCIERVARVLRVWEIRRRLETLEAPAELSSKLEIDAPWLLQDRRIALWSPPSRQEWQRAMAWCSEQPVGAPGKHRPQDEAARRRQTSLQQLGDLLRRMGEARVWSWRTCPVCAQQNTRAEALEDPARTAAPRQAWQCRCDSCGSEWGLLRCGSCKDLYPALKPPSFEASSPLQPWEPDRQWGRDLWGEPSVKEGKLGTACPCADRRL